MQHDTKTSLTSKATNPLIFQVILNLKFDVETARLLHLHLLSWIYLLFVFIWFHFTQVERRDDKKNALELRLKFWEYENDSQR